MIDQRYRRILAPVLGAGSVSETDDYRLAAPDRHLDSGVFRSQRPAWCGLRNAEEDESGDCKHQNLSLALNRCQQGTEYLLKICRYLSLGC